VAAAGLFLSWFKIREQCPTCGFVFGRGESGYQLGAMALDLVIPLVIWFFSFFGLFDRDLAVAALEAAAMGLGGVYGRVPDLALPGGAHACSRPGRLVPTAGATLMHGDGGIHRKPEAFYFLFRYAVPSSLLVGWVFEDGSRDLLAESAGSVGRAGAVI